MLFVLLPDGSLFSCGSLARICPQVIITLMYFLPVSISSCYLLHLRVQQIWQNRKMQKETELPHQKHLVAGGWGVKELGFVSINNNTDNKTAKMKEILFAIRSISWCSTNNQGQERWSKQNWSCLCFLQMSLLPDSLTFLKAPQKEQQSDSFVLRYICELGQCSFDFRLGRLSQGG